MVTTLFPLPTALRIVPTLTREQYNAILDSNKRQITFLSLQDLKGSKYFGGSHDKLGWVHDLDWDLLIIDEAHERRRHRPHRRRL